MKDIKKVACYLDVKDKLELVYHLLPNGDVKVLNIDYDDKSNKEVYSYSIVKFIDGKWVEL